MRWIRPITIAVLAVSVTAGFFIGKITSEAFFGFATGLVVWWFKSRDDAKGDQPDAK